MITNCTKTHPVLQALLNINNADQAHKAVLPNTSRLAPAKNRPTCSHSCADPGQYGSHLSQIILVASKLE